MIFDLRWSLPLVLVILTWAAYSTWHAFVWPFDAAMFPIAIGIPAIILGLMAVGEDWRGLIRVRTDGLRNNHEVLGAALFMSSLIFLVGITVVLGQRLALYLVRSPISGRLG